jgi:hypothetical protein
MVLLKMRNKVPPLYASIDLLRLTSDAYKAFHDDEHPGRDVNNVHRQYHSIWQSWWQIIDLGWSALPTQPTYKLSKITARPAKEQVADAGVCLCDNGDSPKQALCRRRKGNSPGGKVKSVVGWRESHCGSEIQRAHASRSEDIQIVKSLGRQWPLHIVEVERFEKWLHVREARVGVDKVEWSLLVPSSFLTEILPGVLQYGPKWFVDGDNNRLIDV